MIPKIGDKVKVVDSRDGVVVMRGVVLRVNIDIDDRVNDWVDVRGKLEPAAFKVWPGRGHGLEDVRVPRLCVEPDDK